MPSNKNQVPNIPPETNLDFTLLFFRSLEEQGGAELAEPLLRYLKATDERRRILVENPDLAAAVTRIATANPTLALRLGLV